jgi:hypothetical protein
MLSIGLILIFGIIMVPVYILILASIFGKPHNMRVTALFIGVFGGILLLGLGFTWLLSKIVAAIIP